MTKLEFYIDWLKSNDSKTFKNIYIFHVERYHLSENFKLIDSSEINYDFLRLN